jgi:hypothetical protein
MFDTEMSPLPPNHREMFFSTLKKELIAAGVKVDEAAWNNDPKAFLGPNYQKIVALIDVFSQYDSRDLYKILDNVQKFELEKAQTKMFEPDPAKVVLQQVIAKNFVQALKNPNDKAYSVGVDSDLMPPLDERLFSKAEMLAGRIGMEIYNGKIGEGSITSKILFQPGNRNPLTLESLQPSPNQFLAKAPVLK